ncbi:MAG: SMP-30/gluconolactonase/LRE family protein [Gemmataceae bacterium]
MKQLAALLLTALLVNLTAAQENKPIPGIGPKGEVAKVQTGFKFTEGPAADVRGNVFFSDIPNNRIHKLDAAGKLSTALEDSEGANGLMFDKEGRLVACLGRGHKVVAIDLESKKQTVLADECEGKPLGGPNDLVIDKSGGIYFTDPGSGSVYYAKGSPKATRVLRDLPRPNGVILSPDEKTLIVLPSGSADVLAYPVEEPGKLGAAKVLCQLEQNPKQPGRKGGDGLTIDTKGNLYLTKPSLKAIQVVSPEGKTLGLIYFPEDPANCTFGGPDRNTLYVTAQTSLYAVKMEAVGHRFAVAAGPLPEGWDYAAAMKKVAARFKGKEGVVLHVGGSMTIANPYTEWARKGKGKTEDDLAILKWMHAGANDKSDGWWLCRTELEHYRAYTSESGLESPMLHAGGKRGLPPLKKLLEDFQPRIVIFEVGIYDVENNRSEAEYRKHMAAAFDLVLNQGAIPVMTTIPPFKAQLERTKQFNVALRELARERGMPLIDLEREVFARRPDDWYNTLVNRIHMTAGNCSVEPGPENLAKSGYLLRGWLTVRKISEIKQRVLD